MNLIENSPASPPGAAAAAAPPPSKSAEEGEEESLYGNLGSSFLKGAGNTFKVGVL